MNSEWRSASLIELVSDLLDHRGRTPKKLGGDFTSSGVPVISAKNIRDGRLDLTFKPRLISEEMFDRWMPKKLKRGDVLLTSEAPMGEAAYLNGEYRYCLGQRLFALRPRPDRLDGRFLYFSLRSPMVQRRLYARLSGTTAQGIRQSELAKVELDIPPLVEQRRIAGVLGALDDKIEVERQKREHLDLAIRVAGAHLIRDGATEWPLERMGDHFVTARGLSYTGAGLAEQGSGVPLHNLNSVLEGGGYKFEGIKYYVGDFKERHVIRPGDLVVANTEQGFRELLIGFPAIIPTLFGSQGIFSHHLHRVTPLKTSCFSRCWLYVWLLNPANHDLVAGYANGTTVNMLPVSALEDPVVPVPPPERIRLLDEVVGPLLAEIETSVKQAHHLVEIRDAVLPKLVSGQLGVQGSYDPDYVLGKVAEEAGAPV
jgi:type I restriction enzyme S subunit